MNWRIYQVSGFSNSLAVFGCQVQELPGGLVQVIDLGLLLRSVLRLLVSVSGSVTLQWAERRGFRLSPREPAPGPVEHARAGGEHMITKDFPLIKGKSF